MKICFAVSGTHFYLQQGGAELQAYLLYKYLLKKGHEIYYIYNRNSKSDVIYIDHGVNFLSVEKPFNSINFLNRNKLNRLLSKLDVDIYYQRGLRYLNLIQSIAKKHNKKFILGISMESQCYKKCPQINRMFGVNLINNYLNQLCIRNADLIISQTNVQKELLGQHFGCNSIVIPSGHPIPLPPFEKSDPPIIAWIANIKQWKQPEIFIKLAQQCCDLNVKFIYAGRSSTTNYQQMLIAKTKKLSNLSYYGELPVQKTNELLAKSALFVNTSVTHEGFPNTYIQAWLRETPVVALNFDPDNLIKSHEMGLHSGNFDQMVKDIRYLINNKNVRKQMGRNARKYALENHDIEKIGEKYLGLFQSLIH